MRKLLLMVALLTTISLSAQEIKKYQYCELVGTGQLFSTKLTIQVDFGQATSFWKGAAEKTIKDESGKAKKFNSMIDAMNYYGSQGWEFVQAYAVTTIDQNVYHWLLKKEVKKEDINIE